MTAPPPSSSPARREPGPLATVGLYVLARVALVVLVTLLLMLAGVPLLVAVLVGIIVALPLSMVLFRGLRARMETVLAEVSRRRAAEREGLRARLRGDEGAEG